VYNRICCLDVVSWKGDHPAMSPQSCRSEVRLFSLLLGVGCVSVSTGGLGWDSNLLRCLWMFVDSFIDDLTYVRDVNTLRTGDEFSRLWRFFFTTLKDR
jgi:hypothetical protein